MTYSHENDARVPCLSSNDDVGSSDTKAFTALYSTLYITLHYQIKNSGLLRKHTSMYEMEQFTTAEDFQQENRPVDGIEGIAVRIHERAIQLSNEQELLRQNEQELQELKNQLEREKEKNQIVRAQYLQNVTKMHSIEIK